MMRSAAQSATTTCTMWLKGAMLKILENSNVSIIKDDFKQFQNILRDDYAYTNWMPIKVNSKKLGTNERASELEETQKETYQLEFYFVIEIERTQKNKNQIEFYFVAEIEQTQKKNSEI